VLEVMSSKLIHKRTLIAVFISHLSYLWLPKSAWTAGWGDTTMLYVRERLRPGNTVKNTD